MNHNQQIPRHKNLHMKASWVNKNVSSSTRLLVIYFNGRSEIQICNSLYIKFSEFMYLKKKDAEIFAY